MSIPAAYLTVILLGVAFIGLGLTIHQ